MNAASAEAYPRDWPAAWNDRDLERAFAHACEEIIFHAPRIAKVTDREVMRVFAERALRGDRTKAPALRRRVAQAGVLSLQRRVKELLARRPGNRSAGADPHAPSKGSCISITSSRSGEVETSAQGLPTSSSRRRTYFTASAGRSFQLRAPRVEPCQPGIVS